MFSGILNRRKARNRLSIENGDLALIFSKSDRMSAFFALAAFYEKANPKLREEIRNGWNFNLKWIVPRRNTLAQTKLDDLCPEIKIRAYFVALVISPHDDYRDALSAYAFIYHSALAAGIDVIKLFKDMAEMADCCTADLITKFINRPEEDKSLAAWGLIRVAEPDGPRFEFAG